MITEKLLSELSKPAAHVSEESFSSDGTSDIMTKNLPIGSALYSQECVFAMLAALEEARKESTYFCNLNAQKNERIAELEARIAQPVKIPHPDLFDDDEVPDVVISVTSARLRAQGFSVERETFKC